MRRSFHMASDKFSPVWHHAGQKRSTNPELIQQTASLQLCSVFIGDAEVPASKDLVAKALEAIRILDQVTFESRGGPSRIRLLTRH